MKLPREVAETLFHDDADGVALLDPTGRVLRANAQFSNLAGVTQGGLAWAALPAKASSLLGALRGGRAERLAVAVAAAGRRRVLRLSVLPVPGGGGLLRVADHTHEQELEEQLGQSQRLQAVGELAGGIAHDFNNLLTAILGAADDLRARARPDDTADLDMVRKSAERGADLVRHLLAFSRQQTLQPRVVSLNDSVQETASLLQRLLGAGTTLDVQLEEPGRQVRIDPTQLSQVLTNLAVNARNAMGKGGRLTISTGHQLILQPEQRRGETVPPGRYVRLSVADTGSGIPPEVLPRIFEPFFTTRRDSGGTGLGLSTVHGIVRQSGGYMDVHSAPGQGTRFDILLPRYEDAAVWQAPAMPAPAPVPARKQVSRTLLLVDDDAPIRALAERVLTRAGWNVVAAASAEDALELVELGELGPALACVISDVVMPGLDGPSLVRTLRQQQPGLPAILMSGYADATLRQALQAEDILYLGKPFAMADLKSALGKMLADDRPDAA